MNPDIVQLSCLLLSDNVRLTSDFQVAYDKDSVGWSLKCVGFTVDDFKSFTSADRVGPKN